MSLFVESAVAAEAAESIGEPPSRIVRQATIVAMVAAGAILTTAFLRDGAAQARAAVASDVERFTSAGSLAADTVTATEMRNVHFRVGDGVKLRIHYMAGTMRGRDGVVDFDDPTSFVTRIDTGRIGLTGEDLSNLLNRHVFAYGGAPLQRLRAEVRGSDLRMTGIMRKGVEIPFDIIAVPSVTPDGRLKLHPVKTRILGVNGESLMKALGLDLAKLLDLSKAKGVTVKGNDLFIEPLRVLPPPTIKGRVAGIQIENGEMVQLFARMDSGAAAASRPRLIPPDSAARKYMYFRGGVLHFGKKMVMENADMLVVGDGPSEHFDFDLVNYQSQLVAGYSKTLPSLGLEVFMPNAGLTRVARGGEVERATGATGTTPCACAER